MKIVSIPPLRTYTLNAVSGANSRDLSIFREGASSALYTTCVAPIIDMHHPNSITMNSASSSVVGVARMYRGCDTINLALGDPGDFTQRESCVWEDLHINNQAVKGNPATHHFGLSLGDESRRFFHWVLDNSRPHPTPVHSSTEKLPTTGRTHSWSITEHVPRLSRSHTFSISGKSMHKKDETVTTVHEVHVEDSPRWCFKLIDRDDGEIVAMLLRHQDVRDGALVKDEDPSVRGKFAIFRDFWEPGQYQEEWDKMILLSGLAVLERG